MSVIKELNSKFGIILVSLVLIFSVFAGADGASTVYYYAPDGVDMSDISKGQQSYAVENKTDKFETDKSFNERDETGAGSSGT
jgi:hypothetical protein